MAPIRIIGGIAWVALCVGCAGVHDARLEPRRQTLTAIYKDETRPMAERLAAFDDLLETFTAGTRETTLDRFIGWPVGQTKSRIDSVISPDGVFIPGNTFSLHLLAPDGSDRWMTMSGDRVQ